MADAAALVANSGAVELGNLARRAVAAHDIDLCAAVASRLDNGLPKSDKEFLRQQGITGSSVAEAVCGEVVRQSLHIISDARAQISGALHANARFGSGINSKTSLDRIADGLRKHKLNQFT